MNGEEISAINALCDKNADEFQNSAYGQFTPERIKADLAKLQQDGFEIRRKTDDEINCDCAKITGNSRIGIFGVGARGYPKKEKRKIINKVNALMRKGVGLVDATRQIGTTDKSYYKFNKDLGLEPLSKIISAKRRNAKS